MKTTKRSTYVAALVVTAALMASCGGTDTGRPRNAALPPATPRLPYSCAQLESAVVPSGDRPVARFVLCDEAEKYMVVAGSDTVQDAEEAPVPPDNVIEVPVDPGDATNTAEVWVWVTRGAEGDQIDQLHRYVVGIGEVGEATLGVGHPRASERIVRVEYTMPPPYGRSVYLGDVPRETHHDYVDDIVQKWSMITQRTCYPSPTLARMSMGVGVSSPLADSSIAAKRWRNRNYYVSVSMLRNYTWDWVAPRALCAPGTSSYNMFSDGVESGYVPVSPDAVATTTDVVALLKSYAVVHMEIQVRQQVCDEVLAVSKETGNESLAALKTSLKQRVEELAENDLAARAAGGQIDVLDALTESRVNARIFPLCARIAGGYSVVTPQDATENSVATEVVLPLPETVAAQQTPDDSTQTTLPPTTVSPDAVVAPAPPLPKEAVWAVAQPTLRVKAGSSLSGSRLLSFAGLRQPAGAKVRITRSAASKARCTASTRGVKALRPGSCRVTVKVTPRKGKAVTKSITVTVTK